MSFSKRLRRHGRKVSKAVVESSNPDPNDLNIGNLLFDPSASGSIPVISSDKSIASNSSPPGLSGPISPGRRVDQLRKLLETHIKDNSRHAPPIPPRNPARQIHRRRETSPGRPTPKSVQQHLKRRETSPEQPPSTIFQELGCSLPLTVTDSRSFEPRFESLESISKLHPTPLPHRHPESPVSSTDQGSLQGTGRAIQTLVTSSNHLETDEDFRSPELDSSQQRHRHTETSPARVNQRLYDDIGRLLVRSATDPRTTVPDQIFLDSHTAKLYNRSGEKSPIPPPQLGPQGASRLLKSSVFDQDSGASSLSSLDFAQKPGEEYEPRFDLSTNSNYSRSKNRVPLSSKIKPQSEIDADPLVNSPVDSYDQSFGEDSRHLSDLEQETGTEPYQVVDLIANPTMAAIRASTFFDPSFERLSRLPESQRFTRNEAKQQEAIIHAKLKRAGEPIPPYEFQNFIGKGTYGRVYQA